MNDYNSCISPAHKKYIYSVSMYAQPFDIVFRVFNRIKSIKEKEFIEHVVILAIMKYSKRRTKTLTALFNTSEFLSLYGFGTPNGIKQHKVRQMYINSLYNKSQIKNKT